MVSNMIQQLIRLYQTITQRFAQERGAVLVYVAVILPALIAVAALAIDASNAYAQQRRIQTAADAAALAGAQRLALGGSLDVVASDVQSLATANGADSAAWEAIDNNTGVRVTVERTVNTFFAGSIGYHTITVRAAASARYLSLTGADNLLPMAIKYPPNGFVFGQSYTLWDDGKDGPGSFGWISWNGNPSAKTLEQNIANPSNSGLWNIGDQVPAAAGVMNSASVWDALAAWQGKEILIPIYDIMINGKYRIYTFAEFTVVSTSKKDKTVTGYFSRTLRRSASVGAGGADLGVRDVRMTE